MIGLNDTKRYYVWLATSGKNKVYYTDYESRARKSASQIKDLIADIDKRAQTLSLVRRGLLTIEEAREYMAPVRFMGVDVLK